MCTACTQRPNSRHPRQSIMQSKLTQSGSRKDPHVNCTVVNHTAVDSIDRRMTVLYVKMYVSWKYITLESNTGGADNLRWHSCTQICVSFLHSLKLFNLDSTQCFSEATTRTWPVTQRHMTRSLCRHHDVACI